MESVSVLTLSMGYKVPLNPHHLSSIVSTIISQGNDLTKPQMSLEPLLTVAHYTELKNALLNVLKPHMNIVALPGKQLGVTQWAEHHKVKTEFKSYLCKYLQTASQS